MNRTRIILIASTSITIILFLYALWVVPQWQVEHLSMEASEREVLALENEYRKTLSQIIGGAFIIIAVYLGWRRVAAAEKTIEVSQEEQITERFTRAVDQVGSNKLEIRLGGIYALERIAKESEKDYWPIMEVLTAYVRVRSPRRKEPQAAEATAEDIKVTSLKETTPTLPVDIQAVLTVIGRRIRTYGNGETQPLNLSNTDLRNGDFGGANLEGANLQGANLGATHFEGTNLSRANLQDTNLAESVFGGANLRGVRLYESNLSRVAFFNTELNLSEARKCDFTGAVLWGCDLSGSRFTDCNFDKTNFNHAKLTHTKFDSPFNLTVGQIKESKNYYGIELPPEMQRVLRAGRIAK